ncbi:hypothetical protein ACFE04_020396 [Oxalis oulophora]
MAKEIDVLEKLTKSTEKKIISVEISFDPWGSHPNAHHGSGDDCGERDLELGMNMQQLNRIKTSPSPSQTSRLPPSPSASPKTVPSPSPRVSTPRPALVLSGSGKSLHVSNSSKSLHMSNSGKRMDQKKKYVKQVTGRHNDTELHLAAQRGDVDAIREILGEIDAQMSGSVNRSDFDAEVSEIRASIVNEVNELGETALFTAAERGHLDVVKELLQYTTQEGLQKKNQSGFDPLHIAANQGHQAIVQVLLDHDPSLSKTIGQANSTPLISAAARGHTSVVQELLDKDSSLLDICRTNGKNALHLSARQGYVEIVKALLKVDPQIARRTDKKGQTALHMAVKGISSQVVRLLLQADPAIVMLPDKYGNTALHIATRKKRVEIVNELLRRPEINVNALTKIKKTALDMADQLPLSEEISEIKETLAQHGGMRANELNQPRDELRRTVREIQKDVSTQLEQARKTNRNVSGIAKELKKFHRAGINNATNSVTVVAVLFATLAFAAIFTVPGGDLNTGMAVTVSSASFKIFFIFNAIALFTSLAVVLVQITLVRGETKAERRVVEVINKLLWLASVCTTVAFTSSSYIVVGRRNWWAAILVTAIGGIIMAGVLGTMTYYVVKYKRKRKLKKKEKLSRHGGFPSRHTESDSDVNPIYAI